MEQDPKTGGLIPQIVSKEEKTGRAEMWGHAVDEELLAMIRKSALGESPNDGFVSSMHSQNEEVVDKLVVYAWGDSARVLAEQLKIVPM